jgi:hypothetical protein
MWPFNRRAEREKEFARANAEAERIANREHNLWKHVLQIQAADDSIEPTDHQQRNHLTITKLPRDWNQVDYDTSRHLRQASAPFFLRLFAAFKTADPAQCVALYCTYALCLRRTPAPACCQL